MQDVCKSLGTAGLSCHMHCFRYLRVQTADVIAG